MKENNMDTALDKCNFRVTVVAGTNTTTQTLTGIETEDTIIGAIHWTPGATCTTADITANVSITDTDEITFAADYSSDSVIVFWTDKSCGTGYTFDYTHLRCSFVDGSNATTATMTGVAASGDTILAALHISTKADNNTVAQITDVTITAANQVTFGSDYSNDLVIVWWVDGDGGGGYRFGKFNIKMNFIDGHATTQTLTGIATEDKIITAWNGATKANQATITEFASSITISAANTLTFGSSTANNQLIVFWVDCSL